MHTDGFIDLDRTNIYIRMTKKRRLKTKDSDDFMTFGKEMANYAGKWVCVIDNEIVAKGNNATTVYDTCKKKYPEKMPLVMKVPTTGVMLL